MWLSVQKWLHNWIPQSIPHLKHQYHFWSNGCGICICILGWSCGWTVRKTRLLINGNLRSHFWERTPCTCMYKQQESGTVVILNFRTDQSGQTVQTQIRLLRVFTVIYSICIILTIYPKILPLCLKIRQITANFSQILIPPPPQKQL